MSELVARIKLDPLKGESAATGRDPHLGYEQGAGANNKQLASAAAVRLGQAGDAGGRKIEEAVQASDCTPYVNDVGRGKIVPPTGKNI